jgi:hypothetical protein
MERFSTSIPYELKILETSIEKFQSISNRDCLGRLKSVKQIEREQFQFSSNYEVKTFLSTEDQWENEWEDFALVSRQSQCDEYEIPSRDDYDAYEEDEEEEYFMSFDEWVADEAVRLNVSYEMFIAWYCSHQEECYQEYIVERTWEWFITNPIDPFDRQANDDLPF